MKINAKIQYTGDRLSAVGTSESFLKGMNDKIEVFNALLLSFLIGRRGMSKSSKKHSEEIEFKSNTFFFSNKDFSFTKFIIFQPMKHSFVQPQQILRIIYSLVIHW